MEARHEFHETYYNNHLLFSELEEDRAKLGAYLNNNFAIARKIYNWFSISFFCSIKKELD